MRASTVANTKEVCLWCGMEINEADEVFVERSKEADDYEPWSGAFCGDEHASLWVAKPFPKARETSDEGILGPFFFAGCLSVFAVCVGLFGLGAVVAGLDPRPPLLTTELSSSQAREGFSTVDAPRFRRTGYRVHRQYTHSGHLEIAMTTARDIMTGGVECADARDTLVQAAKKLRDLGVGALPICGEDGKLAGMLTDRDIVVRCIAEDRDPHTTTAGDLAEGKPVTIGADDSIEETLRTMSQHAVRRLPVIDGHDLVGIVSQADVAKNMPEESVGQLVEAISGAPSNDG